LKHVRDIHTIHNSKLNSDRIMKRRQRKNIYVPQEFDSRPI
jgi:hypothetical protein